MAKDCDKVVEMMKDLGCTGKRVTKELIESRIEDVDYQVVAIAGQKMMFCGIKMLGGFVAVGKPAVCIDPANWRDEIGQKISYDNSFGELWKLEAYHMMYATGGTHIDRMTSELAELEAKRVKLNAFFDTALFSTLPELEQDLLQRQYVAMNEYCNILDARISKAN